MIKPKRLQKGDTIAIVALSWGGHEYFPHIVKQGIKRLEHEFGFKVKLGKTLNFSNKELYENPKKRAEDLHEQFLDKNVKGIITIIGGNESVRVLPYLDINLIKNNFKFFMGYSDIATFNTYLNTNGLVTFNGPAVMAGFAESKELEKDFAQKKLHPLDLKNALAKELNLLLKPVRDKQKVLEKISEKAYLN